MIKAITLALAAISIMVVAIFLYAGGFERPPVEVVQRGFRGTGMYQVINPRTEAAKIEAAKAPEVQPPVEPAGTPSSQVYQNVKVLGDVDSDEFTRLMAQITEWVSPEQGCNYCHTEDGNFASDALYTKVVARRMFQMVRKINVDWENHVGKTGVTCYTCHRGRPVPSYVWTTDTGHRHAQGLVGNTAGQNQPSVPAGLSSLPFDPFTPFLEEDAQEIRAISPASLPGADHTSIKKTEWTYSLMMHFSKSLGVNCTYCHNTRSFAQWDQSTPQRGVAWYGIRMVRDTNVNYLESLANVFPRNRLGPHGDVAKVNCTTCHQGAFKPLYGASMLKDYPELAVLGEQALLEPNPHAGEEPAAAVPGAETKTQ